MTGSNTREVHKTPMKTRSALVREEGEEGEKNEIQSCDKNVPFKEVQKL